MRLKQVTVVTIALFLGSAGPVAAQDSLGDALIGSWRMEDAYTFHAGASTRIESHEPGRFAVALQIEPGGVGSLDGTQFRWQLREGVMTWDFDAFQVSVLPRVIDRDTVLVVAIYGSSLQRGSVVSVLHRSRAET